MYLCMYVPSSLQHVHPTQCVRESPVGAPGVGYRVSGTLTQHSAIQGVSNNIPSQPMYGDHNKVITSGDSNLYK